MNSKNPNLFFFKLAFILSVLLVLLYLRRLTTIQEKMPEGFTQDAPFILKQNQNVYDNFYAEMYDSITDGEARCQKELIEVIKMTEPSSQNSVFLDIGAGTGNTVHELRDAGYYAYGLDKSKEMIEYAESKFPEVDIQQGDVLDSMTFDKSSFTHILCTNFTIYEIHDKKKFFSNCYYWLQPNAYLIVHLVNPNKFKITLQSPFNKPTLFSNILPQTKRITETTIEYKDYKYDIAYKFSNDDNKVVINETFTDNQTNHIRQNENTLYMNSIDDIVAIATRSGFIVKGKTNQCYKDTNQYLYIFERTM
jgi:ubiquinone/menaquinone biosynthesis C-methylase UbiE